MVVLLAICSVLVAFFCLLLGAGILILASCRRERIKSLLCFAAAMVSFLFAYAIFAVDAAELQPVTQNLLLLDKYHDEECIAMTDANGQYIGENCGDDWVLVALLDGQRKKIHVSDRFFEQAKAGQTLVRTFDLGRLGIKHSQQWKID